MVYYVEYFQWCNEAEDEILVVKRCKNKNEVINFLCEIVTHGARVSTRKPKVNQEDA